MRVNFTKMQLNIDTIQSKMTPLRNYVGQLSEVERPIEAQIVCTNIMCTVGMVKEALCEFYMELESMNQKASNEFAKRLKKEQRQ